jgi:nuclear RNA export factor
VLSRRYDINNKVLNLTNICAEPEFQGWGLGQSLYDNPRFIKVLCAMCEDAFKTPEERAAGISGIQLAGNSLGSLNIVKPFVWTFPDLLNLDLSNNNISKVDQLAPIRKYSKLQHIILTGNPIEQHNPDFRNTLIRWFPQLKIIDSSSISEAEAAAAKGSTKDMPLKVAPGLYHDTSGIGENSLKEFFMGFNTDRPQAANFFYDETSQFSLAVNTNSLREPGADTTTQRGEWSDWIRSSRNLLKLDFVHARKIRLHKGMSHTTRLRNLLTCDRVDRHCQSIPNAPINGTPGHYRFE